jgi:hypothetical protein
MTTNFSRFWLFSRQIKTGTDLSSLAHGPRGRPLRDRGKSGMRHHAQPGSVGLGRRQS